MANTYTPSNHRPRGNRVPRPTRIFPYKNWGGVSDSDTDTNSDASGAEAMPEKAVRAAANMTEPTHQQRIYMRGIKVETNTVVARRYWTDYERKRLQQSMELAARWSTQPNTGSVYARDCRRHFPVSSAKYLTVWRTSPLLAALRRTWENMAATDKFTDMRESI
ncbi:hypothetical protein B0H14DRAFT_2556124 [Mycena olivaceomarginata]|nr:hypothetical protein B0H14DRAFT_2556124 [Mycena olivaceomarginata]